MSFPVRLWLATRIAIFGIAGLSIFLWPHVYAAGRSQPATLHFVDGLCQWDCREYALIAARGYEAPIMTNFWPMLPWLARPLVWLHVPSLWAVVLVANAAALGAFVFIHRVFVMLEGEEVARWGLVLFAAWPFAFFYASGYTESVMICASAAAMWLALGGRHVAAGLAFAGGVLARTPSTLAWLGLAAAQLDDKAAPRRARWGLVIPVAFALVWPLYAWVRFGDPLQMVHVRTLWGVHAYASIFRALRWRRETPMVLVYPVIGIVPVVGGALLLRVRRWRPLAAFAVPQLALYVAIGGFGFGRYSGSVWPAFLPLGVMLARRASLQLPVVVACAMLQGFFLHLFAHAYGIQ